MITQDEESIGQFIPSFPNFCCCVITIDIFGALPLVRLWSKIEEKANDRKVSLSLSFNQSGQINNNFQLKKVLKKLT